MKSMVVFALLSVPAAGVYAQEAIPSGTVLPVRLNSSVSPANGKPEQIVTARVMQNVLLPGGSQIHRGTEVVGHVIKSAAATGNSAAEMVLTFDSIKFPDRIVPLRTSLRAVASNLEVEEALTPRYFDDATASTFGTTTQVGGEVVYRGGGHVMSGETVVGEPVSGGVLSRTRANLERGCREALAGNDAPQSLWIFSSDACGAYGLPHLTIAHAGRRDPKGEFVLSSDSRRGLHLCHGSALLLRVL